MAVYVAIGTLIGLSPGYLGGWVDQVLMRLTDTVLSIPTLLLVIIFVSVVGPSLISVIAVIGLLGWPSVARIVRGQLLSLREAEFIAAARVLGVSDRRRSSARHLLPNLVGPLTVVATFGIANAILLEAALSFLGLGVQAPEPSLGNMIIEARAPSVLHDAPWFWLPPGILSRCSCWASTSSATACATRSIRARSVRSEQSGPSSGYEDGVRASCS